jgi:hypothetical protein
MINVFVYDPTYFFTNLFGYAWSAFGALGDYSYPIILLTVIGYVYLTTKSLYLGVIAIMITFATYATSTSIFSATYELNQFLALIVVIAMASFVIGILLKKELW